MLRTIYKEALQKLRRLKMLPYAQSVDKSGKIVDNRREMCKSALQNFLPVLHESKRMDAISLITAPSDRQHLEVGKYFPSFPHRAWITFPHYPQGGNAPSGCTHIRWTSFPLVSEAGDKLKSYPRGMGITYPHAYR